MSRYIDADVLRDKLYEADAVTMRGVAIINNEPTVDAVQVVRCGECKWWKWNRSANFNGLNYGTCERKNTAIQKDALPNENWFCADGERRSE